jgi:phage baseplate assembly protein W
MATFIGFSTVRQNKNFVLVDYELIKQDLLNAFNIRQGEVVGRPGYGTLLWTYLFENQTPELQTAIYNEVQRVIAGDPRLYLNNVTMYPQNNGILLQLNLQTVATTTAQILSIFFNESQRSASYV